MYKKYPAKKSKKTAIILMSIMVLAILGLFFLELFGVTNFYSTNNEVTRQDTGQSSGNIDTSNTQKIDYSPAKPEDSVPIPDKNPNLPAPSPSNPELEVVITNTRLSGSNFLIKAVISGTDSATCRATMTKGSLSAIANSNAVNIEGQYSCKDLSIPMSQLPESGDWNLKLTVTDKTGASATTSQDVKL